jgi:outer membrane protein assembly factor BamB
MKKVVIATVLVAFVVIALSFVSYSCSMTNGKKVLWRNDGTGIYDEKGLLKSWPSGGPELLWHADNLGDGHSSVAVSKDKLYVTGMIENQGYLHVFDLSGKLLNSIHYGEEWYRNYEGTRGTPTINDGKIYIISGMGEVICLDERTLNVVWKQNMLTTYSAENIRWGITESPLIIGNKLILTPGGKEHNVVAVNKNNGELIWTSAAVGELSAYCSPLYIKDLQVPIIATITAHTIIGLEAATGKLLWSFESRNRNHIHSNTPVYADNMILFTSVDRGCTMVRLSNGGRNAEVVWELNEVDNMMGGLMKLGDYIYGSCSGYKNKLWYCINWHTGNVEYTDDRLAAGVTIFADDLLYFYSDKGDMALVRPDSKKLDIISQFKIEKGTGPHWAHPINYKGVLYVRHGDTLMAYNIKA